MTVPLIRGGDTSNRHNGPPGVRGLKIWDIPFHHRSSDMDLERFEQIARYLKPSVIGLGMTLTLFALPIAEIKRIVSPWGGKVYFDAAHQLGLISAGLFQDPLQDGADLMTGSSGKTFSGPQGGIMAWNDNELTEPIHTAIFPTLTGSHQINRVAALAVAKPFACGRDAVQRLEAANIIANEMPLPWDIDPTRESGIRLGTVEVTRLGMKETHMEWIARQITEILLHRKDPTAVADAVIDFMKNHRTVYYCHEHGLPR